MSSFRVSNINFKKSFMALAVVVAAVAPGLSAFVSADQITDRSIALSSAAAGATGVSYDVNFTSVKSAGAFVVEFCANSPVISTTCTAPAGMQTSGVGVSAATTGFTATGSANKVVVAGTIAATSPIHVELTGITNPTAATNMYARIVSYTTDTQANAYESEDLKTGAQDQGSVALSITNTIGVSAAVQETMSFCVSGQAIGPDCAAGTITAPALKLGEEVAGPGSEKALVAGTTSTGSIYSQISTNAVGGAVVNLKSNAVGCGGLMLAGTPGVCHIKPAKLAGIDGSTALFGVTVTGASQDATGIFQAVGSYNPTTYYMGFDDLGGTGVTSTYGDTILNTNGLPANNKNATLTFGATVTNSTPAGSYSADLSLIATGKF